MILLIEDNPIVREIFRFTLATSGFVVREAQDGRTALETLDIARPDLIVTDLGLPDTDGFELVREFRRRLNGSPVPILAVSGLIETLDSRDVGLSGFPAKTA